MKMEKLKKNNILIILLLILPNILLSQEKYDDVNLILIIDDKLVTQNLELNFIQDGSEDFIFNYNVGKQIKLPEAHLNSSNKIDLDFSFSQIHKKYKYNIEFKKGWLNNTNFLVIRIYNLDKQRYKKVFCNEDEKFLVEVQNSVYNMQKTRCKKDGNG